MNSTITESSVTVTEVPGTSRPGTPFTTALMMSASEMLPMILEASPTSLVGSQGASADGRSSPTPADWLNTSASMSNCATPPRALSAPIRDDTGGQSVR